MTTMNDLREKRAKTWEKAKAFLDTHQGDDGRLSAEDDATYSAMMDDMDALASAITRMEKAEAIDKEMARTTSKPLTVMPGMNTPVTENEKPGRASAEYRKAFWDAMRMNANPYEIRNTLSEGVDSEGGYLVPDEFETHVVTALEEENFVRTLAKVIQTSSGDRKIPVVATHGIATWLEEGKAYSESDEVFDQMTLGSYKLGTFLKISEELLNDAAFDVEAYLASEFARRIGAAEEEAFLVGSGTGQPTGIFTASGG